MSLAVKLHNFIEEHNTYLKSSTKRLQDYYKQHPTVYKAAVSACNVFRTTVMAGFIYAFPVAAVGCAAYCFTGSLFYRMTIESECTYIITLPSLAGATSFIIGQQSLVNLISGAALVSIGAFSLAVVSITPLSLYLAYVVLTVSYDVDRKLGRFNQVHKPPQAQQQQQPEQLLKVEGCKDCHCGEG
jgi:hypothetical protein